jgi:hypothetical protein
MSREREYAVAPSTCGSDEWTRVMNIASAGELNCVYLTQESHRVSSTDGTSTRCARDVCDRRMGAGEYEGEIDWIKRRRTKVAK